MELSHVICEKRTYSKQYDTHDHAYGQLLFPLQGGMEIKLTERNIHLEEKYGFFLPPGCLHTFRATSRNEFLIVDLPKYVLTPEQQDEMYFELTEQWTAIRFLLLEELQNTGASSTDLTYLGRYISKKLQKKVARSIQYIHEHFPSKLTIEQLSQMENYHPAYYSIWFKKQTGMSPATYIQHVRLDEAKRLLTETSSSITTISNEVGFDYPSSFTRAFIRYEGISPQMYRKTFQKDK
ncbi:transcriptional regulator [Halalkalibacter wakoensis JCM 9140]|uniref:Transcriptional regulator n=1 Tax=Halalkalibacter wakoensis JCM 9140 TaxID=1236970 RepID=W4Q8S8_9BACI|nr:AraC family transcriptional regulator [Halalkalibacter wakoensis]GAE28390.1 transcriptional regulator [Halalkalibacter wakoensis JCM 9140]